MHVAQDAEKALADGLKADDTNPMLHWFIAQYLRQCRHNKHVELLHIVFAEVRHTMTASASVDALIELTDR